MNEFRKELEKDNGWAISILIAVPILLVLWLINNIIQALFNSDKKEKVENKKTYVKKKVKLPELHGGYKTKSGRIYR